MNEDETNEVEVEAEVEIDNPKVVNFTHYRNTGRVSEYVSPIDIVQFADKFATEQHIRIAQELLEHGIDISDHPECFTDLRAIKAAIVGMVLTSEDKYTAFQVMIRKMLHPVDNQASMALFADSYLSVDEE